MDRRLLWWPLLVACPAPEEPEPGPVTCDPGVQIGGSGPMFSVLAEGDPVTMVHGPQGGWHVEVAVRVTGLEAPVDLHWWIDDLDTDTRVSESWLQIHPWAVPDDPCAGDFTGMFGFLDVTELEAGELDTPPELLVGAPLQIGVEASDPMGGAAEAILDVVAEPDPSDL